MCGWHLSHLVANCCWMQATGAADEVADFRALDALWVFEFQTRGWEPVMHTCGPVWGAVALCTVCFKELDEGCKVCLLAVLLLGLTCAAPTHQRQSVVYVQVLTEYILSSIVARAS